MSNNETGVTNSLRTSHITKGRILLLLRTSAVVIVFVALRLVVNYFGWDFITFNTLIGSFVGGVFFTLGIILAGVITDFKEAEKIPNELAVLLKALHYDTVFIAAQSQDKSSFKRSVAKIEELLITINTNFKGNHWHKKELDNVFGEINNDIIEMGKQGVASGMIIKLRDNLTNIDRLSHRIDTIIETSFIPAAYTIATAAITAVIVLLIFANGVWESGGWLIAVFIVFVMVSVFLLIRDIDNPFEYNKNTCADVDLSVLFKLESFWEENWK